MKEKLVLASFGLFLLLLFFIETGKQVSEKEVKKEK